jgi:spermidine/putrescine-binding protein
MRSELDALWRTPIGRRTLLRYGAVMGGAGLLAACRRDVTQTSGGGSPTGVSRPSIGEEPGVLRAYEWAGFELKPLWKQYRLAGYAEPKFSFYTNTEQALAKTAGGYTWDVAHPEVGYLQDYLNLGSIQPWDQSLIPNFASLNPALVDGLQIDGQQYGVPLDWGYSAIAYRSDEVDIGEGSYMLLFDDRYEGKISWFDTPWILQMAHLALGLESDQFDMSAEDLQTTKEFCIEKKKNLRNIWVDFTAMWDDLRQGNIWLAYSWPDTYVVLNIGEGLPVEYLRPIEGSLSWYESLVLNSGSENYYHAHEFADAWASPETGRWLIDNYGYGHANLDTDLTGVDERVIEVFGLEDPVASLSEPNSHLDRYQPQRDAYNRAWDEVKAA